MQNIEALMTKDLILFDLKCLDREDCIRQMAGALLKNGRITALEPYVESVMERERLGVTGIGMQVAIPHGKSSAVRTPSLVFARCDAGVDFRAMDGSLANLIFLIAVPSEAGDLHLRMLSQLARSLMHDGFRDKLLHAGTEEEVLDLLKGEG
ncbi:PTS sugar transporter subunit IIA [Enterocloster lavalensis]|uniref:PTS sugar transporter subunit IIA n=1 Tax=Enterocloster lavalensis TaxID=460384 RepID=UPI0023F0ABD7|nr:PTS sugar transporter subunit IIA [Enterocloster lavalensis]